MRDAARRREAGVRRHGTARRARRHARRVALGLATLCATVALTTAAHAQLGDVGEDTLDTDSTPVAKESVKWEWWAGARYGGSPKPKDVPQGSATPFELDFFDVAFHDLNTGLAGGAICRDPVPKGASPDEARAHTAQCERVPALYRYSVDEAGAASWSPLDLGAGTARRGYVGAIAWLDSDTALAVGGDGCYPRREEPCPDGNTPPGDPAGKGRAWLYDAGSVSELADLPAQMRGLTALGAHSGGAFAGALRQIWRYENGAFTTGWSGDSSAPQEVRYPELFQFRVRDLRGATAATAGCCRADPLQSAGPRFLSFDGSTWIVSRRSSDLSNATGPFEDQSKSEPLGDPLPGAFGGVEGVVGSQWNGIQQALLNLWGTVEGGWDDRRRYLEDGYYEKFDRCATRDGESKVGTGANPTLACIYNEGLPLPLVGGHLFPEGLGNESEHLPESWPLDPSNNLVNDPDDPDEESVLGPFGLGSPPELGPAPAVLPDPPDTSGVRDPVNDAYRGAFAQLYGATKFVNGWGVDGDSVNTHTQAQAPDSYYALFSFNGTVESPGGPPPGSGEDESGSVISNGPSLLLTTARIVSADESPVKGGLEAVGLLRSSGQGILVGGDEHDPHRVNDSLRSNLSKPQDFRADEEAHGCKIQDPAPAAVVENGVEQPECDTNAQRFLDQQRSLRLFKLDSYALNAIEVVDGAGWAVGDHGAIHARQPPPPPPPTPPQPPARAGAKLESEQVSSKAFEEHRPPVTDQPGVVPGLVPGMQPTEPGFYEGQVPNTNSADQMVMSRDGSEGWAFKGFKENPLYYDGTDWRPCDLRGVPGQLAPDRACAALAALSGRVNAVARVPLERDADPGNDDEFEAVALTADGFYRYREGRWSFDRDAAIERPWGSEPITGDDVVFTAPDDGWVVRKQSSFEFGSVLVFHFDGERWWDCTADPWQETPAACGDGGKRLGIRLPREQAKIGGEVGLTMAGERVYLFAVRDAAVDSPGNECTVPFVPCPTEPYPVIVYHDRHGTWQGGEDPDWQPGDVYNPADGGWDPGCVRRTVDPRTKVEVCEATGDPGDKGRTFSMSVAQDADGSFQGWAVGTFGGLEPDGADAVIMRLSAGWDVPGDDAEGVWKWRPWMVPDAANEYLRLPRVVMDPDQQLTLPAQINRRNAFLLASYPVTEGTRFLEDFSPALAFDQERKRWEAIATPWSTHTTDSLRYTVGKVGTIASDGRGGFWAAVGGNDVPFSFHHYTDHAPEPVFEDVSNPVREARITGFGVGANGTMWIGDVNGLVYRYDRLTGWSRPIRIPGWDPKQTTNPTGINAVSVGPDGEGVAVGPGGRIATLGDKVGLDPAATVSCGTEGVAPPCGTAKDLLTAAVAPDGSAVVLGEDRTLLWRPAGGGFRTIEAPPVPLSADTIMAMPRSNRVYLLSERTRIVRGEMSDPGVWSWQIELGDAEGSSDPLTTAVTNSGEKYSLPITDIAVDASGHGYAVGREGLLLERTGDGDAPWSRISSGYRNNLQKVTLPASGGEGALIGGEDGLILTIEGERFEAARFADPFDPALAGGARITALALAPGYGTGDVEAWAVLQTRDSITRSPFDVLLHYPSDAADPRLDLSRSVTPLADIPRAPVSGVSFAAFGKQDCDGARFAGASAFIPVSDTCGAADGSNLTHGVINRRIRQELARAETQAKFAIFTGDAVDLPGGRESADYTSGTIADTGNALKTPLDRDVKHRRWVELVADPLTDAGVPVLGAIGGQDLTRNLESCHGNYSDLLFRGCFAAGQAGAEQFGGQAGVNLPWRAAMASMPASWEGEQTGSGLSFVPVEAGMLSQDAPSVETPSLTSPSVRDAHPSLAFLRARARTRAESYPLGSGDTHYAVDVINEETDELVARIVVVDTSMRSIAASDPQQHPIEVGGQLRWLEEVLCFEGSAEDTDDDVKDCTREEGQQAIVVSNTPTYSYAPISPEELQTDAAVFESVLFKNQVNVVVSGRLGWQGRYWALAPGVHAPCPGQPYRADSQAPSVASPDICGAGSGAELDPDQATEQLPDEAKDAAGLAARGAIPFVVSSSAGGRFNVRAERGGLASAQAGFWRGYSLVRLHPSGDPSKTIVEQRPILDWVGLEAKEQELEPRAEVDVRGYAREAFGMDTAPRYYDIPDTEAITHRYHLLLAHPDEPWRACEAGDSECEAVYSKLAKGPRSFDSAGGFATGSAQDDSGGASASAIAGEGENPCEPYLCLPERVGAVDPTTGEVSAGNGKYPDTFALAMLSVGDHVAAQPLVFKRSPSFVVNPARTPPGAPELSASAAANPQAPPPPNVPKPNVPQPGVPEAPALPGIPPLAAAIAPEPQPPAPPSPPPPSEQPAPLDLTVSPQAIAIATPTAVIQPPTPPVNPAPPGGARREARQRQAAAQKSGADSEESGQEGPDLANKPPTAYGTAEATRYDPGPARNTYEATRRERGRPEPSFTALSRAEPSSLGQGALWTGGATLGALLLALAWTNARPTPRRRQPELPAAAWTSTCWGPSRRG